MLFCFVLRFFVFHLYESPKYLMGRGRDAEAVEIIHKIAAYNGRTSSLTLAMLEDASRKADGAGVEGTERPMATSAWAAFMRQVQKFSGENVYSLFATRKLAWSTSLLIAVWALIGLAFPL